MARRGRPGRTRNHTKPAVRSLDYGYRKSTKQSYFDTPLISRYDHDAYYDLGYRQDSSIAPVNRKLRRQQKIRQDQSYREYTEQGYVQPKPKCINAKDVRRHVYFASKSKGGPERLVLKRRHKCGN